MTSRPAIQWPMPFNNQHWTSWAQQLVVRLNEVEFLRTAQAPSALSPFTTDDLAEGTTNLYFTNERAQDAVGTILTDTATIDFTYNDGLNTITADVKNNSITFAKMQAITDQRLLGASGGTAVEEIAPGTGLSISANSLNVSLAAFTTSDLAEGSNLYFTGARAISATAGTYLPLAGGTMTGPELIAAGSAAAPSLALPSGTTGIYSFATNTIGFSFAGLATTQMGAATFAMSRAGAVTFDMTGETASAFSLARYTNTAGSNPSYNFRRARGTIADAGTSTATVANGDTLAQLTFFGHGATAFQTSVRLQAQVIEPTPSDTAMAGRFQVLMPALGAVALSEVLRAEYDTGFSAYGANVWLDQNRVFRPRSFTVGTIPTPAATGIIGLSDEGGRAAISYSDGTNFRRLGDNQVVSATVDYRGVWSNLTTRERPDVLEAIRTAYNELAIAGLTTKLKGLWVHALGTETDGLLNWITPGTRNLSKVGTPSFTAYRGFTGDGSSGQLTAPASWATFGAGQNDISVGTYVRTSSASAAAVIGQTTGTRRIYLSSASSSTLTSRIPNSTGDTFTPAFYTGLFTLSRGVSTDYDWFLDDSAANNITRNSQGLQGNPSFLATTDATGNEYSTAEICFSFVGVDLSVTDVANLRRIMVDGFLRTVGAVSKGYAVARLPLVGTVPQGTKEFVTDANSTTFASTVAGGGANIVPVFNNGTNWIIG